MVDFEFQDPTEIDFHGLKALLGNFLDGAEFSSSPLCDAIIAQKTVGTVIKAQGAGGAHGSLDRGDVGDEHSG